MLLRRNVHIKLVLNFGDSFTVVVVAVGRGDYLRFMFSGYLEDSFFLCFGENRENGWMMMMGLVYECGDLFFFGLYRYFALHGIFDSTIMIFWLSMMTSFVDC